jgi:hypothetical protein
MPVTGANLLAHIETAPWIVENDPKIVQIMGAWQWLGVDGGQYRFGRTTDLTLRPAQILSACDPVTDGSDPISSQAFECNDYTARYQVCDLDADKYQSPTKIADAEFELAKIKDLYGYFGRMGTETGSAINGGLPDLCDPGRKLNLSGAPLSSACLERAYRLVTANSGYVTAIMSNSESLATYRNLCWQAGITPPEMEHQWYDPHRGWVSGRITTFRGTPWYVNDLLATAPW